MALIDLLSSAQGGAFFANAGNAAGVDARTAESAIAAYAPAIAAKLKAKAAAKPEAFESLLDIIEDGDGTDLEDASATTGDEALSDGRDILKDLYGASATAEMKKLVPGLDDAARERLSAISATTVLAVLGASNAQALSGGASAAAAPASGGFISVLIAAILKGFLQSAQRQLAPKRRRRRSYTTYTRRRTTPRRRRRTVGLDDLFKDILGGRR